MGVETGVAGYIGRWRPSSVSPPAAAFAREVIARTEPAGRERAKNLLWAAGKLADYALALGLDLVPEVVFCPSVIERFARCAPGLSGAARRTLRTSQRFIGRHAVPQLHPADVPLPRERAKVPCSPAEIAGFLALADAQPTRERRMRAAGLVCLGAGAGLVRGDLRDARGTDVACRSGGVIVTVRGAGTSRTRWWPRWTAGEGCRGWTPAGCAPGGCGTAGKCLAWPRSCTPPGSAAPSGSAT
jgi:integrase